MNIVNENGSLNGFRFLCLTTNSIFWVIGTEGAGSVWLATDTVKKDDGNIKQFSRMEMRVRFNNVKIL